MKKHLETIVWCLISLVPVYVHLYLILKGYF